MTALPRLQTALEDSMRRPPKRRFRRAAPLAAALAGVVAAVAVIGVPNPPDDVEQPAKSAPVGVVAQVVRPAQPAGDPQEGQIELRASDPATGKTIVGLVFRDKEGTPCLETGPESAMRRYPVREGGSCLETRIENLEVPVSYGGAWSRGTPYMVHGFARPDVTRLELDGPSGRQDVPISTHRAWLALFPVESNGSVSLVAHLKSGEVHRASMPLDPVTEVPGLDDPVRAATRARPAEVDSVGMRPVTGTPLTTFELAVPSAASSGTYDVSLDGPSGEACAERLDERFVFPAGSKGRIRPIPPHRQDPSQPSDTAGFEEALRSAPWCRGQYRLTVRFRKDGQRGRGKMVARLGFQVR